LPIVEGFDFSAALVPADSQGVPNQMIRIVHLPTLFSHFRVSDHLRQSFKLRIVDDGIEANNQTLELFLEDGRIRVEPATTWDVQMSIQELAAVLFSGQGPSKLQPLFPEFSMLSYDEY
jgi:predicted acetyltransferase